MPKIQIILEASSPAEAAAMMQRAYGDVPVTDDDIRDYLVRKGWWKPGVENGPLRGKLEGDKLVDDAAERKLPNDPPSRKNVSPGVSTITKIGSGTKEELLSGLKAGRQPAAKYSEHMKLLWSRHEVKFDGEEYYI